MYIELLARLKSGGLFFCKKTYWPRGGRSKIQPIQNLVRKPQAICEEKMIYGPHFTSLVLQYYFLKPFSKSFHDLFGFFAAGLKAVILKLKRASAVTGAGYVPMKALKT